MRPKPHAPYSWRDDQTVPDFDDTEGRILVVMDGHCALCSAAARRIAAWDTQDRVRIATVASPLGAGLLRHFEMSAEDPESWLMLAEGRARGSLDAMVTLFPALHWGFAPLRVLRLLPFSVQDWLYARIARNRYRIWGHADLCALPDPALRRKLLG